MFRSAIIGTSYPMSSSTHTATSRVCRTAKVLRLDPPERIAALTIDMEQGRPPTKLSIVQTPLLKKADFD